MVQTFCLLVFESLGKILKDLTFGISKQVKIVMPYGGFMFYDPKHCETTVSVNDSKYFSKC